MTLTTQPTGTTEPTAPPRNLALGTARVLAGLLGTLQLAGAGYFLLVAPEEAGWLGPWIDVPVLTVLFTGIVLTLATAVTPRLRPEPRIRLGLTAAGLTVVATLAKIPLYDEPEGVTVLVVDAVLLTLLLLAGRTIRRGH